MIVKNGYSIILGNTQRGVILNNPKRKILNGGGELPPLPQSDGLFGTRYVGYFGDNPDWFLTATPHGDTNQLTQIDHFSSSPDHVSESYYSWQWTGYFRANSTEDYTFYTSSDDASYLWIGDVALSGYNVSNALVNNGGPHGDIERVGITGLIYNQYYPIRIQFGEIGGADVVTVSFSTNRIPKTTNGTGYYFGSAPAPLLPYYGRVLSLDAVPYDRNPNQVLFTDGGVITSNGVYVYTQTGAPISGSMFNGETGFYGPVVSGLNNFINLMTQNGITGYFVGDWALQDYTYFNTGNIPFVNRIEVNESTFNVSGVYTRLNSGDNSFTIDGLSRKIIKNNGTANATADALGYWKLDNSLDSSIGNNTFSKNGNGSITYSNGIINNGIVFNGSYSLSASFGTYSQFSYSVWAKGGTQTSPYSEIFLGGDADIQFGGEMGQNTINVFFQGTTLDQGSKVVTDNNWHHVVLTWDGNIVKIYVDGVLDQSAENTSASINLSNFTIGGQRLEIGEWSFNGIIDEVAIWDRVLLENEIIDLYKNPNIKWLIQDDDNITRYINDDVNLDLNGWYYNYTNTVTLSDFYGYVDGTVYTNKITVTNAGTFDDAYTRVASSDGETVDDNNINYIPFVNGTKTIASKGQTELNDPYGGASYDAFRGWYLYDSALSDGDFPRYGINTDDAIPTTLPAYTSVKSFRVSGLANIADDGVYSRSAGVNTPFTKAGSNPIVYEAGENHGWKTWTYVTEQEQATHKLSNSAEITTEGWERDFVDKIVFSGANNIANGTYVFKNQYANEEESYIPVLTVLGSGGSFESRGWRISATYDFQTNNLALQTPPQTIWWNGAEAPVWYVDEEFGNPIGMETVMTSQDRGLTWTSPYIYQFDLNGFTGPHTAYNKTYTFTSAGSLIPECEGEGYADVRRVYYGGNMYYQVEQNIWRLQFSYTYSNGEDTFNNIITLQKTGPSPVGTWTSVSLSPCGYNNYDPLIINDTIVGSNAIAISAGSGTLPTISISEIEYVSGDGNYSNPTLTSQITGDIISVDGTYTRNIGGITSFSNGLNTIYYAQGDQRWEINVPGGYNNGAPFANEDFNLTENNWFAPNDESFLHVGTSSHTTARYYPANKTDGLLGIQYSGYFDNDPTWFNTATVQPIITGLTLTDASEDANGIYINSNYLNQGTYRFDAIPDTELRNEGNYIIFNPDNKTTGERYWGLYVYDLEQIQYKSYDLINWTDMADGSEGAPKLQSSNTINSENSTLFSTSRSVMNGTSWEWVGYFRPQNTSDHSFNMYADENAYFWIGDKALNGYTTGNADMFSSQYIQATVTNLALVSGVNYPVRMQWGHPANPTNAGLSLGYNDGINAGNNFSGLFFNFTGNGIATNSNVYVYDFTLGEWQSTNTGYNPAPNAVYSHVWLDSISGFNNSGITYTGNKHVTLVNNPVYSSDYSGIYSFNGVDQYAMTQEVPQSTDGSISYFVWFKPTGAGVVVDELGQPGLFGGWHDSQLEVTQDGKVNFGIWGDYRVNSTFKIQSTGSIDFDLWHHLGLTYAPTSASSGILSAYINGEKIADSNCSSRLAPGSLYYGICGGDSTNMGEGGFGKGSVGSFQVYNKGLTEIQVGNLYSGEKDRFTNIDNMFSPSVWLKADAGVISNNSNVSVWQDQSNNGNNAVAKAGEVTIVNNSLNGKPVLRFNGSSSLITNSFYVTNYNTPITIIAVSRASASDVRGSQPTARYVQIVNDQSDWDFGLTYGGYETENPNFSVCYGKSYAGSDDIESSPIGENAIGLAIAINDGSIISSYLNGTLIGTANSSVWNNGGDAVGSFSIGSEVVQNINSEAFFATCDIAEILIYNRALTTSERQEVENYLSNKYAISLA
jgi:Concanavalin A-like lectin/glucanases superfamily/GLEYA domain